MRSLRWAVTLAGLVAWAALHEAAPAHAAAPVRIKAWLDAPDGQLARLSVQASLARGWHTYSNTADGQATQITVDPSLAYRQVGAFRADSLPAREVDDGKLVEKHAGTVTWSAPVELAEGCDPSSLCVTGKINLLVCEKQFCQPVTEMFVALLNQADGTNKAAEKPKSEAPASKGFADILGGLGGLGGPSSDDPISVKAWITKAEGDNPPHLVIEANIEAGWHIYSITQPKGGPLATKITPQVAGDVQLAGEFQSDPAPKTRFDGAFNMNIEEHEGRVRWSAPLKLGPNFDKEGARIAGTLSAQACDANGCRPPKNYSFVALDTTKSSVGEYRASQESHVLIRGHIEPKVVTPGSSIRIHLTAVPDARYHIYALNEEPKSAKPTLITLTAYPPTWKIGPPTADTEPSLFKGDKGYEQPVTWTMEIEVPPETPYGSYTLKGAIGYQVCFVGGCDQPKGADFTAQVQVASSAADGRQLLTFSPQGYDVVRGYLQSAAVLALQKKYRPLIDTLKYALGMELFSSEELEELTGVTTSQLKAPPSEGSDWKALVAFVVFGFLGGLILNVMPCVLPVIGLKIMSFVQQGGESRGRILALNIWFSLGLIAVFLVLAGFAAFAGLGWGAQFQEAWFTLVLTCVVFAFALALLGVWEVPIPGFVGSGAATELAAKEGASGAFAKGVLTTILATPCTGPFLGPALAWAVKQPAPVIFVTFAAVGLGMASPFLLIGAFPKLIAFLPKPGAWMETFKKIMGFVLLATVVWLLSFMDPGHVVPAVIVLCGLGVAFWWIGHTPITASGGEKARAWLAAGAVTAAAVYVGFGWFDEVMKHRLERRFEAQAAKFLNKFLDEPIEPEAAQRPPGRYTVMVDFTADW